MSSSEWVLVDLIASFIAHGKKVKVKINAKIIPTDIIFPNSITGLISPIINERKAIAVVNAANKQGITIWFKVLYIASSTDSELRETSENLTKTCTVNEMVSISNSAMKLEEMTLIFQSINPSTLAVKAVVTNALPNGKRTSHIFWKNI